MGGNGINRTLRKQSVGFKPPFFKGWLKPCPQSQPLVPKIQPSVVNDEGLYLVGEDGFGPSKLNSNRFTVCPLWPLGNSPIFFCLFTAIPCGVRIAFWSWWTDSNPRPADYKSAALPTELHQQRCNEHHSITAICNCQYLF